MWLCAVVVVNLFFAGAAPITQEDVVGVGSKNRTRVTVSVRIRPFNQM